MRQAERHWLGRWTFVCGMALVFCFGASGTLHARGLVDPADVKAAFLYRFTGYIEWPGPPDANQPFTIAVLGADDVAASLRVVLARHRIHDRPSVVRTIPSLEELGDASMLYVGAAYMGHLAPVVRATRGRPVLVVSDREGALEDGSTINFVLVDRRIRFEISLDAARGAGLKVGPGLLAVALHVRGGPRSGVLCPPRQRPAARTACALQLARR
jgi:hypothetical protein